LPAVTIDAEELSGRRADDVEQELTDAGLIVTIEYVEVQGRRRNRVVDVDPEGALPVGSEITLYVGGRPGQDGD
jgi:beta-lactam-binding protein with PASTA domain